MRHSNPKVHRLAVTIDFEVPPTMSPQQCVEYLRGKAKVPFVGVKITKAVVHDGGAVMSEVL